MGSSYTPHRKRCNAARTLLYQILGFVPGHAETERLVCMCARRMVAALTSGEAALLDLVEVPAAWTPERCQAAWDELDRPAPPALVEPVPASTQHMSSRAADKFMAAKKEEIHAEALAAKSLGALGITKAKQKSDLCATCYCFDETVVPAVTRQLAEVWTALAEAEAGFWKDFDKEEKWDIVSPSFCAADSPEFVTDMICHIESMAGAGSSSGSREILHAQCLASLQQTASELEQYRMHFQLRDQCYMQLWEDKIRPAAATGYLWADWQEPLDLSECIEHVWAPVVQWAPRAPVVQWLC